MIPLLGPGIYTPKYRVFPVVTEFSGDLLCEKMLQRRSEGSNSHPSDYWFCLIPLDHSRMMQVDTKYKTLSPLLTFPAWRNVKYQHRRGSCCPSPMLLFYIPRCRKTFPAWRNVIYQHGRGKKCSGTNRVFSHSQNCNFPEESFVLSTFCNSVHSLMVCIFDPACELLPPWRKELYLCTVAPLLYLLSDLLPPPPPLSQCTVQYMGTVCDCGGGGGGGKWNVLWTVFCRSFTLCFWSDSEHTKLLHHPKQKWPVNTTKRDWLTTWFSSVFWTRFHNWALSAYSTEI